VYSTDAEGRITKLKLGQLSEYDLETILFDLLPQLPGLRSLDFSRGEIGTFTTIENRIKRSGTTIPNNGLREFNLWGNPVVRPLLYGPRALKEKAALKTILNTFTEISSIGICCYDPGIQYLLAINHAGRKFIHTPGNDRKATTTNSCDPGCRRPDSSFVSNFPPSLSLVAAAAPKPKSIMEPGLWPTILERAYSKRNRPEVDDKKEVKMKRCTGVYYLLRNGSVLQDITEMREHQNKGGRVDFGASLTAPPPSRREQQLQADNLALQRRVQQLEMQLSDATARLQRQEEQEAAARL